jgi:phosphoribosylformylglycinamidine cyclo-ligase
MHADGAGTKSILAYLYWKETGDTTIWKGIAQDAIVMNLDDLLCVGIHDRIGFSSTIDRNKKLIPAEVLEALVSGHSEFFSRMKEYGVNITYMGGETADVGDVVRTIAVNGTMSARWPKNRLITNEKISPGDCIIGLNGFGHCDYEPGYNSGIASNGLTSARHDMLNKLYAARYHESYDNSLDDQVVYIGPHKLTDTIEDQNNNYEIGRLLLSPTRTFAPVVRTLLTEYFDMIHGMVHCSGGGQTKCLKYFPDGTRIIKDKLPEPPVIFRLIQQASQSSDREMYSVFNMGTRLEIYTSEKNADTIIGAAKKFGVGAQVIGRVEKHVKKELLIELPKSRITY